MAKEDSLIELGSNVLPHPIAVGCGRIIRSRTSLERLDAIIKTAESLTRYTAALSLASFSARGSKSCDIPGTFNDFKDNLSWGHFLSVVQAVVFCDIQHPLKGHLDAGFKSTKKNQAIADDSLTKLLEIRNSLGHDLKAISEAKAQTILASQNPEKLLSDTISSLEQLLRLPLFVIEEQQLIKKKIIARRLLLMGESDNPIPDEVEVQQGFDESNKIYVGTKSGALNIWPWLIWDLAKDRATFTMYVLHALQENTLQYKSFHDDSLKKNTNYVSEAAKRLKGEQAPLEEILLGSGQSLFAEWFEKRSAIETTASIASGKIPWDELDETTIQWYLSKFQNIENPQNYPNNIRDLLLDGRDIITPEEVRQLLLLFGETQTISKTVKRNMIDCRVKKDPAKRWDERIESFDNILQCLRTAIDFFSKHVGIDGATIDGLKATSGTADYIAMREGLVNLFIHQDYDDPRTVAQIEILPERTLFFNAGKSLVGQEGLIEGGKSQSRNPLISRALRLIGFAELAGSGLREVHHVWRDSKRRPPQILSDSANNTFSLILDWRSLVIETDQFWKSKLGVTINNSQSKILSLLSDPQGMTVAEVASATGELLKDVEENLSYLQRQNLIILDKDVYRIQDHLRELINADS